MSDIDLGARVRLVRGGREFTGILGRSPYDAGALEIQTEEGWRISRPIPEELTKAFAERLLIELVGYHYVGADELTGRVPKDVVEAAVAYLDQSQTEDAEMILLESLLNDAPGPIGRDRVAWLCFNAIKSVLSAWRNSGGDVLLERCMGLLREQLRGRFVEESQLDQVGDVPPREPNDCVACMTEPVRDAVRMAVGYVQRGNTDEAIEALGSVYDAIGEGAWSYKASNEYEFSAWLVREALPVSYQRKEIPDDGCPTHWLGDRVAIEF